jgi:ParB-like chromosome segregation protein Spo0J
VISAALVSLHDLQVEDDLARTKSKKVFEDHLTQSISAIGLTEPLKVARSPAGDFVVVDGVLRLKALRAINRADPERFREVPVYLVPYEQRYEIKYQTDIYQDLLPSQLASLVEHLHDAEKIAKKEIARYVGISESTLRNYTGLWRLLRRGGLFTRVVDLMDRGIVPASNPYAWLRLTEEGLTKAVEILSDGEPATTWIGRCIERRQQGSSFRISIKQVEEITGSLPADCYREDEQLREVKKSLGLRRRTKTSPLSKLKKQARAHLRRVASDSREPVLTAAAESLFHNLG